MTAGSEGTPGPSSTPARGPGIVGRIQARISAVDRRLRATRPVRALLRILAVYDAAGGGITASGLAYGALFAVIPGILLVVSVLVIVVDNAETREQAIDWIIDQVPPLEAFAREIVTQLAQGARVGSIIGLIGFIWGASGFYLALEGAMHRLFPGPRAPDAVMSRVRGVIAVLIVVATLLVAFLASGYASIIFGVLSERFSELVPLLTPLVAVGGWSFVVLVVFLLVPTNRPSWRAALVPALLAGAGMGLLTSFFGAIAPVLIGGLGGLGALASVFVALVWFHWMFQLLLYGGAYARIRRDRMLVVGVVR
jgi:uncharacterized BrkB/YihY/UPF0761 family membrane protein